MRSSIFFASIAVHGALAVSVVALRPKANAHEATAISMRESKKKQTETPKVEAPKLPPDEKLAPRRQAKAKAASADAKPPPETQAKPQAASAAMDALPDFGLSLSGGGGPGGFAVATGGGNAPAPAAAEKTSAHHADALAKKPADECGEPTMKPKPRAVPQPSYTQAAREANVEGKVRIEVSVDASGAVTSARLLSGLGSGLDEAALAAARSASFEPATRCGKAVAATFVIAMRFSL